MIRSTLFRRILIIIIVALVVVDGTYMLSFSSFGQDAYTKIRLENLEEEAELSGRIFASYLDGELTEKGLTGLIESQAELGDSIIVVMDSVGMTRFVSAPDKGWAEIPDVMEYLTAEKQQVLKGNRVRAEELELRNGDSAILSGMPVLDDDGEIIGGIFTIKTVEDIKSSFSRLSMVLMVTLLAALPVAIIVAGYSTSLLTKPLYDIADTAIEMSKGDLSLRADASHSGEAGVVAKALNTLCDALSTTISQLEGEKSQLNQILQSFSDGVAAIDENGNLTHYNQAVQKMFGSVSAETPIDLIPDQEIWNQYAKVAASHEAATLEYELPGDRKLSVSIVPVMDDKGSCKCVVGLFNDITEYERLEQTRRDYVANVSHELRSPLTAIRGYLEPLSDGMVKDDETRQKFYQIMLREVVRMSKLITDLLQLSRLQSGTEYMNIEPVDVQELLGDVLESFTYEAGKRGISLELSCAQALPPAMTDRDRIEQILVVLVDNAMRYTPSGGTITMEASLSEGSKRSERHLLVSVQDTGCGIREEELPHLFERFYKVDKSRHEGGSGLGLSIAKQIIDKLDESITVTSAVGEGTKFTFTLKPYRNNAIALGPVSGFGPVNRNGELQNELVASADADFEIIEEGGKIHSIREKAEKTLRHGKHGRKKK